MVTRKKNESDENLAIRVMIEAYDIVIADISQDVGWRKRAKAKVMLALAHRKWELENVWYDYDDVVVDSPAVKREKAKQASKKRHPSNG